MEQINPMPNKHMVKQILALSTLLIIMLTICILDKGYSKLIIGKTESPRFLHMEASLDKQMEINIHNNKVPAAFILVNSHQPHLKIVSSIQLRTKIINRVMSKRSIKKRSHSQTVDGANQSVRMRLEILCKHTYLG